MPRRARSIRWWLATFALATVLPLVVLVTLLFVSQIRREERDARAGALRLARATAEGLEASFRESASLLEHLAQRPEIAGFDGHRCDQLFAVIELFPQYPDLFFFDRGGQLVCSADPLMHDLPVSAEARQWIAADLRRGALVSGKPLMRRVHGKWISAVSREVRGSGVLVLIREHDLAGSAMPPGAVLTIIDRSAVVIARSAQPERWVGRNVAASGVAQVVLRERDGSTAGIGIDGESRQYGFTAMPETGWHLYIGVPTAEVMQPVRTLALRGAVGGAIIAIVISLAAIVLARALAQPINTLARVTGTVAAGAYGRVQEPHGPREIVELAESFNVMVERRAEAERLMAESERTLKALSERLLVVQEEERAHIAREIHDDLGQSLTALKMDVLGLLAVPQPRQSALRERIVATLDAIVGAVQRIASELRPSLLDDLGLIAALESEARIFEERNAIEVELSLPEELDLEPAVAATIYRIIQEALTNVARHSNASRVELRMRPRPADLLVDIRDDGRGITEAELHAPASIGLIGMRERAALVGGTVTVEGIPGRGTIVSVCIPLVRGERSER